MTKTKPPSLPGWLRLSVVFTAGALGGAAIASRPPKSPSPPAPPTPPALQNPAPGAASESAPLAPSASPPPSDPLALAASGELDAIKRLEASGESGRIVAESLAIAEGRAALARLDLASLGRAIDAEPALAHDRATLARLHGFIERESIALDALAAVARVPGPESADLLYAVWRRHRHTTTGLLARDLLRRDGALERASDALRAAVAIERLLEARPAAEEQRERRCQKAREALDRVASVGDRRCAPLLAELAATTGCGSDGKGDCYPCLRATAALSEAGQAVERREPATPWVLPGRRP